jgi:hypothetical protein
MWRLFAPVKKLSGGRVPFHTAPGVGASAGGRTRNGRGRPAAHLSPTPARAALPPLALPQGRPRGARQRMARHKCNGPWGGKHGPGVQARQFNFKAKSKEAGRGFGAPYSPKPRPVG